MKKLFGFILAAAALLLVSCSNIWAAFDGEKKSSRSDGLVELTIYGHENKGRSAVAVNSDSVEKYNITVSGNGVTKTGVLENGSERPLTFMLIPGSYSIKGEAVISGEVVQTVTKDFTLVSGITNTVSLRFTEDEFIFYPFVIDYFSDDYVYSRNFIISENKASLPALPELNFRDDIDLDAPCVTVTTDTKGNVYYLSEKQVKCKSTSDSLYKNLSTVSFSTDKSLGLTFNPVNQKMYFTYIYSSGDGANTLNLLSEENINIVYSGNNINENDKITGFGVYGDYVFVSLYNDSVWEMTLKMYKPVRSGTDENPVYELKEIASKELADFGFNLDNVMVTDLTVGNDGALYILCLEACSSSSGNRSTQPYFFMPGETDPEVYSRGALIKMPYTESGFGTLTQGNILGWYNKKRALSQVGYPSAEIEALNHNTENYSVYANDKLRNLDLYAPSKAESKNYFYGPTKIICKKPDELYIVDQGVNISLADWTKRDTRDVKKGYASVPTGLSSNVFVHNRIVKVDLKTFSMGIEKEEITYSDIDVDSYSESSAYSLKYESAYCTKINISGALSPSSLIYNATSYLGIHPRIDEE